jgi:hypothetical protein
MGKKFMKRTLIAVCISMLALSVSAYAEKKEQASAGGGKGRRAAVSAKAGSGAQVQRSRQVNTRQNMRAQSVQRAPHQNVQRQNVGRRSVQRQQTLNAQTNTNARAQARATNRQNRITSRETAANNRAQVAANNKVANANNRRQTLREQRAVNREQRAINRGTNRNNVTVNRTRNVNRNVRVVNNWRGERFAGRDYYAFRNYRRAYHDRGWWHQHYGTSLTFVFGAPYFWSSGYWYPAWGYNPGYVYPYDGPIYGYGQLNPDQIVVNVQEQLRDNGYYYGAIDGQLGPQTREALAAFQADHGLAVTSAVDEPTLASMGLV